MKKLLDKIYSGYGVSGSVGIEYFNVYRNELSKYDSIDLITQLEEHYPKQFILDLLLSVPSIWSEFSVLEWVEVMKKGNPRSDPTKVDDGDGDYADIYFLSRYLGVDAVQLFLDQNEFSENDKLNVLHYGKINAQLLLIDDMDVEDMDGEYFVEYEDVQGISNKLISESGFQALDVSSYSELFEAMIHNK